MTTAHQITWRERLEAYYYLCRFDKPVGTELVFWPTMGIVDCSRGYTANWYSDSDGTLARYLCGWLPCHQ